MSIRFKVPGTNDPAYVSGFGAVFTDVDSATSTRIAAYDQWGRQLWKGTAPKGPKANKSLSFLGAVRSDARIAEVRIQTGNAPLSPHNRDGGWKDLVVMDDFLYGEPQPLH